MGQGGEGSPAQRYIERLSIDARHAQRPICFDSGLLIDYLSAAPRVADLMAAILHDATVPKVLSTVSVAEITTRPARNRDTGRVDAIRRVLHSLPHLTIVTLDERHALETAYVRGATGLRLPDAAIVATARLAGAGALIGNDRQWKHKPLSVPYHHMDDILALG